MQESSKSRFLDKTLKHLGVDNVGAGIALMATLITDHKKMEMVLAGESPEMRQTIYEAVRPHLPFEPKALDQYVARAGERAEREQLPTIDAKGNIHPFMVGEDAATKEQRAQRIQAEIAEELSRNTLKLTCASCGKNQSFFRAWDENSSGVVRRARRSGWVYDFKTEPVREICPECANA